MHTIHFDVTIDNGQAREDLAYLAGLGAGKLSAVFTEAYGVEVTEIVADF